MENNWLEQSVQSNANCLFIFTFVAIHLLRLLQYISYALQFICYISYAMLHLTIYLLHLLCHVVTSVTIHFWSVINVCYSSIVISVTLDLLHFLICFVVVSQANIVWQWQLFTEHEAGTDDARPFRKSVGARSGRNSTASRKYRVSVTDAFPDQTGATDCSSGGCHFHAASRTCDLMSSKCSGNMSLLIAVVPNASTDDASRQSLRSGQHPEEIWLG